MSLDWWTLALQAVNFLVLVWLLWRFLYRPVKAVIEKRKALADEAFAAAASREKDAEAARQRLDAERADLANERRTMLKKIHGELEAERQKTLDEADEKAARVLAEARESVAAERAAALADLREQAADLAADIAATLLGDGGVDMPAKTLLERFEKQLADLPDEERERLRRELEPDDARLAIVTAAALSAADRERWIERLGARLAVKDKIDFAVDSQILGGGELRFPHAVLKYSWADQLRSAAAALRGDDAAS